MPVIKFGAGEFGVQLGADGSMQSLQDIYYEQMRRAQRMDPYDQQIRREIEMRDAEIRRLSEILTKLKEQPTVYAVILAIKKNTVTLLAMGKRVEVQKPKDMKLDVGKTVRVLADTFAIVAPVDDDIPSGEMVSIKAILDGGSCEIERGGQSRSILLPHQAEVGDRVVIDDSGTIALKVLGPAPSDCIFGEATGITWDDVGGLAEAKRALRDAVEGPIRDKERFARFGKRETRGVMLWGPPGCGKTLLGKAAATAIADLHGASAKGGFYYVKGPELLNMYVGNTEENIRRIFDDARRHHKKHGFPAVVFIDEADAILGRRGGAGSGVGYALSQTIVPQFLAEMDGLEATSAIVLLATNRPNTLDPAIVRDGRIDRRIHVGRPSKEDAGAIAVRALGSRLLGDVPAPELAAHLVDELWSPNLVVAKVFRHSKGELTDKLTLARTVNGAMVMGIVERATLNAMRRDAEGIGRDDVSLAVVQAFNESLAVNHDDELLELCDGFLPDVKDVRPGKAIAL